MTLVTDKPQGLPSSNALDDIPNPTDRREIRLGANVLLAVDNGPLLGETRDIVLRLRCVRHGEEQLAVDGDTTAFCAMKIVTAWELGQPKPPADDDEQPGLFDDTGEDEDQGDSDDADGDE